MRRDDFVDFFAVPDRQIAIHERLEAWASWVRVRPHGWQVAPMFRQYRSKAWQWHERVLHIPVNLPDALAVERTVSGLPEKNRTALRWCYVAGGSPSRMARELAVSLQGLQALVVDGRQMVVNLLPK